MKRVFILLFSVIPLTTFVACNEEDDIRKDIDALNTRLDALTGELSSLNNSIQSLYDVANGRTFVTSYVMDEKGNYTFSLSDGTELVVYGGQPEEDIPAIGINEAGNWIYTLLGETRELTDEAGNPLSATPTDGVDGQTPHISIGEDGYWYYQLVGGEPQRIEGRYNIADITKIPASIFADVTLDGNKITFSFDEGDDVEVYLLGGLDLAFSGAALQDGKVTLKQGASVTLTATQTAVANIVIDPTLLQVSLTEDADNNLTLVAPASLAPGDYMVCFQIFSAEGYRLLKYLPVTVVSANGNN